MISFQIKQILSNLKAVPLPNGDLVPTSSIHDPQLTHLFNYITFFRLLSITHNLFLVSVIMQSLNGSVTFFFLIFVSFMTYTKRIGWSG